MYPNLGAENRVLGRAPLGEANPKVTGLRRSRFYFVACLLLVVVVLVVLLVCVLVMERKV